MTNKGFKEGHTHWNHPNAIATQFKRGRVSETKGTGVSKQEHNRRYNIKHKTELSAKHRIRNQLKKVQYTATRKLWDDNHPDKIRAIKKAWRERNKAIVQSWDAERRALKRNARTATADKKKLEAFYILAEQMTDHIGLKYTVDHIKPLIKGGLHHHDNLQVITLIDNSRKGPKYPFVEVDAYKVKF